MAGDRDRRPEEDETASQATLEELREFLEGDLFDVRARPEFKESLRRRLWEIVRGRALSRRERDPD